MNRALHPITGKSVGIRCACEWAIAIVLCLAAWGTPLRAQQSNSLADAARQARTQKQVPPQASDNQAQHIADQLSEDQNSGDAPGGFKAYNAGDYKVWVPAPFTVDGRDDGGTVVTGPSVGSKRAVVLLGTPIVFRWGNSDAAFHDAATQFASLYLDSPKCTKTKVRDHDAYQCGLAGAHLMGRNVSGNAMFVRVSDAIYPIFCTAPTDSHERDIINDPHSSYEDKLYARRALDREEQDVRSVWQKCDTVFQSIHVREGDVRKTAQPRQVGGNSSGPAAEPQVLAAGMEPSASAGETASPGGAGSLADLAHHLRQAPTQGVGSAVPQSVPAPTAPVASTVPDGFKVQAFNYCKGTRECWNASVVVPADAKLVSSDCGQYVFEVKIQGSPFLLLAGQGGSDSCASRSANDPSVVHWKQLADPESARAPGTYATISSQVTKLDGKPATLTTLAFRKGLTDWMGKRAEIENNGVQLVVGCMAQRDHFGDGDTVCSALIGSFRLP